MKKIIVILAAAGVAYYYFGRKTEIIEETTKDPLEGKIVVAPNGNWLYIFKGNAFFPTAEAWEEYQKMNPNYSLINIEEATFQKYKILGSLELGQITQLFK
jgi:hypothetical protein